MRHTFRKWREERGATMVEMMMVIVLIAGVLGAITALTTSVSRTYAETSLYTTNHRDASLILNQLAQDIRRSTAEVLLTAGNDVTIQTGTTDGATMTVRYHVDVRNGISYTRSDGVQMTLTEHGTDTIPQFAQFAVNKLDTTGNYEIEVRVYNQDRDGGEINAVKMSTEVARYNWGNQR